MNHLIFVALVAIGWLYPCWAIGQASTPGKLVIAGGGGLPVSITDSFIELAGGDQSKIVVIPTASQRADQPDRGETQRLWRERGAGAVVRLHTRSREEADEEAFVAPLRTATGVWFSGGSQSRITEVYLGTQVEAELNALLQRGGVIGGSSAGAAIMSKVMIAGGNPMAKTSAGFGFLPDTVVDQHFLRRNRVNRLLGVLHQHPGLVGIGIDEGTALVCSGDALRVVGQSYVTLWLPRPGKLPVQVEVLKPGDTTSLADWVNRVTKVGQ
ncbi:MAG: cyanophycinase [Planctomycetota bacterium]|nr:cyanophycinase [Planctomycetota bacterium]